MVCVGSDGKEPYTIQTHLSIESDKWTFETLRRKQQVVFRIDPTGELKTIDLIQKGANAKGSIDKGIYK